MTESDVRAEIERIKQVADDFEVAHGLEDRLYENLLIAISEGSCKDPRACAHAALETRLIEFPRYCA